MKARKVSKKTVSMILALVMLVPNIVNTFGVAAKESNLSTRNTQASLENADVAYDFTTMSQTDFENSTLTSSMFDESKQLITGKKEQAATEQWEISADKGLMPNYPSEASFMKAHIAPEKEKFEVTFQTKGYNIGFSVGNPNKIGYAGAADTATLDVVVQNANVWVNGIESGSLNAISNCVKANGRNINSKGALKDTNLQTWTVSVSGKDVVISEKISGVAFSARLHAEHETGKISLWSRVSDKNQGHFYNVKVTYPEVIYAFRNMSVTELQTAGVTSTSFDSAYNPIAGKSEIPAGQTWNVSTGNGLAPVYENGTAFMKAHIAQETDDFEATFQSLGYNVGFSIGNPNKIGYTDAADKPTLDVIVQGKNVWLDGIEAGSLNAISNCVKAGGLRINAATLNDAKLQTWTMKVSGKDVVVTEEVSGVSFSMKLSSIHEVGKISLYSKMASGNQGVYYHVSVNYPDAVTPPEPAHAVDVNFIDKDLTELPYTSTLFDGNNNYLPMEGEIDQPVSKHWFTGNADKTASGDKTPYAEAGTPWGSRNKGVKSNQLLNAKKYAYMNLGQSYDSFEAELEIINGSYHGIAFGKKNEFHGAEEASTVGIYFLNQRIQLEGAVAFNSAEVTGDATWSTGGGVGAYKFASQMPKGEIYKAHIKVSKLDDISILEVWVDGYESRLTVELSNKYEKEEIALVSRSFQGDCGGIKSFVLDEIQSDLHRPDTENGFQTLEKVEEMFDAYYLSDASKSTRLDKVNLAEHWRLSRFGYLSRAINVNDSSLVNDVEVLTYTAKKYTDFELTYSYQQTYQRLGVMIGTEPGEYPIAVENNKKTSDKGAIFFISAEGRPYVSGKLTGYTNMTELWYSTPNAANESFVEPDATENVRGGKEHTVKLVVRDHELYAYIDGSASPCLYADLGESYQGGYISLVAHAKDTQGFKTFSVTENVTTATPEAGGVVVSGSTLTANFDSLKFDSTQFTSYYMEARKNNEKGDMQEKAFHELWTVANGTLNRHMALSDGAEGSKVSALTYNKPLTDFVVSFDYQKYGRYPMLMFGAEKGKYALGNDSSGDIKNGGVIVLLENDLGNGGGVNLYGDANPTTEGYRPMARQKRVFEGYADAPRGSWHTMTVAVVNKQMYIYLDNYGLVTTWALSEDYAGGYVSLMATGNAYGFDNLQITDLSSVPGNSIVAAKGVRDITVQVGTDLARVGLPTSMDVILKNGTTASVGVQMINMNYNGTEEGVYQFTAVPIEDGNVTNPGRVSATVNVRVVKSVLKPTAAVKRWSFDSSDDLKDFKEFFIKNEESGYVTSNLPRWYVSNDGKLRREPWKMPNGDLKNELAILTYTGEQYQNFELEVEFQQYITRTMVMFGSKTPGAYIDLTDYRNKDNPVLAFVELEGVRTFVGNVINTDYYQRTDNNIYHARESGVRLKDYYDKENSKEYSGKWHKMKLRVVGDQASLWVDDNPDPHTVTLTDYDGGYISLVSNRKDSGFDNLKITRLDSNGEVYGSDPSILANGKVIVTIDENASSELIIPKEDIPGEQPDKTKDTEPTDNDLHKVTWKTFVIPSIIIVLVAVAADVIMILVATRKKKKEEV